VFDPHGAVQALGLAGHLAATTALPRDLDGGPSLDPTASLARLDPAPPFEAIADPRAAQHLQLLAAAFAVGCADAARDMAAAYAKVREQFERPIGWFQAIKHICADMAVRCAVARSQLYYAACALDAGVDDAAFHIASAKLLADQAALENGRANIQVHGGIGMTDEAIRTCAQAGTPPHLHCACQARHPAGRRRMSDKVLYEVIDGVGVITLNRPEVHNALDDEAAHSTKTCSTAR
jgi:hypothetical protein